MRGNALGATAQRVTRGATAGALVDPIGRMHIDDAGDGAPALALEAKLRSLVLNRSADGATVLALIDAAPIAEVIAVACRPTVIRQVEGLLAASGDMVRARLARRVFFNGLQPVLAWSLITGNDRARRQRYLDHFGSIDEQRAFEDVVITDGTNSGYVIRAFDSYWDVEAHAQRGARWNIKVVQALHKQLKQLPDKDVRAQDVNGRVWQKLELSVDPALINRAAFGNGEFIVGANATTYGTQQMGYGTELAADAAAGDRTFAVREGNRLAVGDTIALGTGNQTLSVDPSYDRSTVTAIAGNGVTVNAGLRHAHHVRDIVTKVDAQHGGAKLAAPALANATELQVTDGAHFSINDIFAIGTGRNTAATDPRYDRGTVTAVVGNSLHISPSLRHAHRLDDDVARTVATGNNSALVEPVERGTTALFVGDGSNFALNDMVSLGRGDVPSLDDPNFDWARLSAISGNTLRAHREMSHPHAVGDIVRRVDERGSGSRDTSYIAGTVRHEIAHAVDAQNPEVIKEFTVGLGGWWTGRGDDAFDKWSSAMGDPWRGATSGAPGHTTPITSEDKRRVKAVITDVVARGAGSLFKLRLSPSHPITRNEYNQVPVITAAEECVSRGDSFYAAPEKLYAAGGRVFSVSHWYRAFMFHSEAVRANRLSNYTLYAPAEHFAETYTAFYEEAGRAGVAETDYGRLIDDSAQREWVRAKIHARGLAPAGGHAPETPSGRGATAAGPTQRRGIGAVLGSGTGKKSQRPGP